MANYTSSHSGGQIDTAVNQYQTAAQVQTAIDNAIAAAKLAMYPVGAIYISTSSTNPGTYLGGTWTQIEDTFLLAAGTTYSAGSTGGAATVTLTESTVPAHTHTRGTMNITGGFAPWSEGSGASITQPQGAFYTVGSNQYGWGTATGRDQDNEYIRFDASRSWSGATSSYGGSEAHNNMPPYLAVYVFQRTA